MRRPRTDTVESTAMTVLVIRAECPALFRDLIAMPKGKSRANRIRALAALGLQCESGTAPSPRPSLANPPELDRGAIQSDPVGLTAVNQMFSGHLIE
jgi:hypothetical protein